MRIKKEIEDIICDCCQKIVTTASNYRLFDINGLPVSLESKDICPRCKQIYDPILRTFDLWLISK